MKAVDVGSSGRRRTAQELLRAVGDTPLVDLGDLAPLPAGVRLFAKHEGLNPGGSIKDRPVARMLVRALEDRVLEGRRVLDSSSGNAGIAYAQPRPNPDSSNSTKPRLRWSGGQWVKVVRA